MAKASKTKGRDFQDIKTTPKKKKIIKLAVGLTTTLLIVGALVWIFVFNAFGLRDEHIYPMLADVPWVGQFIPETTSDDAPVLTMEELQYQLAYLEAVVEGLETQNELLNSLNLSQSTEINTLSAALNNFEAQHSQYMADRELFDRMIAGEAAQDFARFFESMHPEIALDIFTQYVRERAISDEIEFYLTMFHEMSTRNAADTLQEMMPAQIPLVVNILEALPTGTAGNIINAMEVSNRALIATLRAQGLAF